MNLLTVSFFSLFVIDLSFKSQCLQIPDFVNVTYLLEICDKFKGSIESSSTLCPCELTCNGCKIRNDKKSTCIPYELMSSVVNDRICVVNHCPKQFNLASVKMCSQNVTASNFMDMAPVTSRLTNITYKNRFCSECNDESNITMWSISTDCTFNMNLMSSSEEIWNQAQKDKCSIRYDNPLTEEIKTNAAHSDTVFGTSYVSKCNLTGDWVIFDQNIEWACKNSYLPFGNFKNIYCYVCNSRNINRPTSLHRDNNKYVYSFNFQRKNVSVEILNVSYSEIVTQKFTYFLQLKIPDVCNLEFKCYGMINIFDMQSFTNVVKNSLRLCSVRYKIHGISHSIQSPTSITTNSCNDTDQWASFDQDTYVPCNQISRVECIASYSNMFCDICNISTSVDGLSVSGMPGPIVHVPDQINNPYRRQFSIYEVWTKGENENQVHGEKMNCRNNEVWDSLTGKCRQLVCVPGKRIQGDTCLPLLSHSTDLGYTLPIELIITHFVNENETTVQSFMKQVQDYFEETLDALGVRILKMFMVFETPCSVTFNATYIRKHSLKMFIEIKMIDNKTMDRQSIENKLLKFTRGNQEINNDLSFISVLCLESEEGLLLPAMYSTYDSSKFCKKNKYMQPLSSNFSFLVNKLLFCRQVRLEEKEITLKGSQIYVPIVNKTFGPLDYFKSDKNIFQICWSDFVLKKSIVTTMNPVLSIFSLICTILSMLGIFLTLLIFSLFRNSRTLPVKLLMVLLIMLFLTQLMAYIANEPTLYGHCLILGALLHYFWLCVFTCSMTCSFQMYRVFSDDKPARNQQRKERRLFVVYVCLSLLVPLLLVAGNFTYAYVHLPGIGFIYESKGCSFNDTYGMIGFFIIPISVILASNFCFFTRTCCIIHSVPKAEGPNLQMKHSRIFYKLFVITCISWILQIVDGLFPISLFSFLVTFINGAQGMFVFVSYVVERKTLIFLLDKISRKQNEDGTVTSKMI